MKDAFPDDAASAMHGSDIISVYSQRTGVIFVYESLCETHIHTHFLFSLFSHSPSLPLSFVRRKHRKKDLASRDSSFASLGHHRHWRQCFQTHTPPPLPFALSSFRNSSLCHLFWRCPFLSHRAFSFWRIVPVVKPPFALCDGTTPQTRKWKRWDSAEIFNMASESLRGRRRFYRF